ncbi:MAG: tetratricopeptide repeat protein [Calditrichaeota bacterium]|nr:MAG: tetratricopeptide repeat protein [Calditrichota bacterium]
MVRARKKFTKKELKEDKFILFALKAKDFLEQNASRIGLVVLGAVVLFFGFTYYKNQQKEKTAQGALALIQAQMTIQQGNQQAAMEKLSNIAEQYSGTPAGAQATYALGRYYLEKGEFETARQYFERYLDDYGDDPVLKAAALAGYADCLLNQGKPEEAANFYEKAARVDPDFPQSPGYLFSAAQAYLDAGRLDKAEALAREVMEKYPKSEYKDRAALVAQMARLKQAG